MKGVNIPIMIAALALSILLWLVVYAQNLKPLTPVRYAVKLAEEGLDSNRFVVTKLDELYRFTAVGPEEKLRDLRNENIAAVVDLTTAQPGRRRYPVQVFPENIREYVTNKNLTTEVWIEPLAEKTVPVKVVGAGKLRDPRYELTETIADPGEVKVRGPKTLVDKAARGRARLDLSTIDPSSSTPATVGVEIVDSEDRLLDTSLVRSEPLFVNISPTISLSPEEKTMVVIPNFTGRAAPGYQVMGYKCEPYQVTVIGPSLVLASLSKIQTETINIAGVKESTTYTARLKVPRGLRVREGNTVQFIVTVQQTALPSTPAETPTP